MARVLLVLPVLNEEVVLEKNTRQLLSWCHVHLAEYDWGVQIADNGSTDRTGDIARALVAEEPRLSFFSIPERGRGRVLSKTWTEALGTADIFAYMDIDLSTDLAALLPLLAAASEGNAVAYGSRFEKTSVVTRSTLRETTSQGYRFLVRTFLGVHSKDIQCGFKAVSASAWELLKNHATHPGWFWDTELLLWAERLGMRVTPIAVTWIETRDVKRKSTVRLIPTIIGYLRDIAATRWKLWFR